MSRAAEMWALVVVLAAGGLLLVAELVDQNWLLACFWALATAVAAGLLVRRRGEESSPSID